jgi:hypothetical protein
VKILHICNKQTWLKHALNFRSHYIDLPNGKVVAISEMGDAAQKNFEKEPDVQVLPHVYDATPIGSAANAMAHLNILPEHPTYKVMNILAKTHSAFEMSQF